MNRLVAAALSLALLTGVTAPCNAISLMLVSVTSFTDVAKDFWGYNDIFTVVNKGAIEGTAPAINGVGTFSPDNEVSLGQFLAIATRLVAPDKIVENTSGNITHWALKNYNAAVQIGLINPDEFSSDDASLNKSLTREDMAYLLVGLAKVNGETLEKTKGIENNIADLDAVSANRKSAVLLSYSNGLLQGTGSSFSPHNTTKRSEIAAVFCRVMNDTPRPTVVVKEDVGSIENEPLLNEKGQMSYYHAKKYIMDSMKTAKVYKEGGKYFISCDLATLPKGFCWQPGADVYHKTEGYKFYTYDGDLVDSVGHLVIEVKNVTQINDTAPVSFSLYIRTDDVTSSSISVNVLSCRPNKINMTSKTGSNDWVDFDTSAIFAGIK